MKSNNRAAERRTESDLLRIVQCIYKDACAKPIAEVFDLRDLTTIESRVKDEGVSFLTITLPEFARDLEGSLRLGKIAPSPAFRSFAKVGSIPAFLQGMMELIFNRKTGGIFDENDPNYCSDSPTLVDCIRQICLAFKKIKLPCTSARTARTLREFIKVEQSFQLFSVPNEDAAQFKRVSSVLWDNLIRRIDVSELLPMHGPGATAERKSGNQKFVWGVWHDRLEPFFPLVGTAYSLGVAESWRNSLQKVTISSQEQELPVRIVTVPKTLKSPRIIAIEPCCMQYTQQAIRRGLYAAIESSEVLGDHVNFRDQTKNQELAMTSSLTGQFATIDLSEASDRVPRDLALEMFRANPDLQESIDACRSTSAKMPNGEIISPLYKFASMGSALCFPVEAMYFYTICVMALLEEHQLPVSFETCAFVGRDVYVYGDDIVVPSTSAITVLDHLQKYRCKVNVNKTFWSGNFRESCGEDAYKGERVTPVYLNEDRPQNRQQASALVSWVASANAFYKKGYWNTASFMYCICEGILGSLPYVDEASAGLGRVSFLGYRTVERWDAEFQQFEKLCWTPEPVYRSDCIDGYSALMKCLLMLHQGLDRDFDGEKRDPLHLVRSAVHGALRLKRRWHRA